MGHVASCLQAISCLLALELSINPCIMYVSSRLPNIAYPNCTTVQPIDRKIPEQKLLQKLFSAVRLLLLTDALTVVSEGDSS